MHLMNLADEILFEIFGHLAPQALYQLSTCSQRMCSLALPALYRVVKLVRFHERDWEDGNLDSFIRTVGLRPERAGWVREARLRWQCTDSECRGRIFSLLPKLSKVHTLSLEESNSTSLPPTLPYLAQPSWIQDLVAQLAHRTTATRLRSLKIMDYQIKVDDIFKLFGIPGLDYLCVASLDIRLSEGLPQSERALVSRIEVLKFLDCSPPVGPLVKGMLRDHQRLKKFTWSIDSRLITSQLSPAAITAALEPLRSTVEELHLAITLESWTYAGNEGTQMDFAPFSRLKILKIHDNLLFASDPILQQAGSGHCLDASLYQRLPPSLERLHVLFDLGFWRKWKDGGTTETYDWMVTLVEHKNLHIPLLRQMTIMERMKTNYLTPSAEGLLGNKLWKLPEKLRRVVDSTGVILEVWTMPPTTMTSWISL